MDKQKLEQAARLIIDALGVDPESSNYKETPRRFAQTFIETFGEKKNNIATFESKYEEMVLLRDHSVWSMCPHHLLPVKMVVDVAYIPRHQVLGLSKIARVVDQFNTEPLLQEDLMTRVADWFMESKDISAHGSACRIAASHLCMQMRGVKTTGDVVTIAFRGRFNRQADLQALFFRGIR